jgi:Polysaccharide deacetylase
VTLFVYPSAVSNAAYALTWEQLRELQATGLVDIQSHTYWHPNFREEKRRLPRYLITDSDRGVRFEALLEGWAAMPSPGQSSTPRLDTASRR